MPRSETPGGKPPFQFARLVLYSTLAVAVLGSTIALALGQREEYRFFDPLISAKAIIAKYAVEEPDFDAVQRAAIDGMLEALDDPYAAYIPPQDEAAFEKGLTGEYVGIGAEIIVEDGVLHIVSPLDDSPAWRAGVQAGDDVLAIDGEPTEGVSVVEAVDLLTGEPGTEVTLTIVRDGVPDPIDIAVTRDRITTRTVRGFARTADEEQGWRYLIDEDLGIAYFRLSQFTPSTYREMLGALADLGVGPDAPRSNGDDAAPVGGLIIDVRDNPGGLLTAATEIADLFLDEGIIVSTRGRTGEETVARADADEALPDLPIAVVINGQSASASEVLAGALVDHDRAIAVGTRSFGKGSVQTIHKFKESGAQLKLTQQRYYLPSGRSIQRQEGEAEWGVDPSPGYFAGMTEAKRREMIETRRARNVLGGPGDAGPGGPGSMGDAATERWDEPAWIETALSDPQLAEALRAVQARLRTGAWPSPDSDADGDDAAPDRVLANELSQLRRTRTRILRELSRLDREVESIERQATAATAEAAERSIDLVPDEAELVGGSLVVRDASGEVVARLRIDDPRLEAWLIDAGVRPIDGTDDEPDPAGAEVGAGTGTPIQQRSNPRPDVPSEEGSGPTAHPNEEDSGE